jgi:integrase
MPRPRRDIPWLDIREDGFYYANWYDAKVGRTRRQSLKTRNSVEATLAFGRWLVGGTPRMGDGPKSAGLTVNTALDFYWTEHCERTDDRGRPLVADAGRQKGIIVHLKAGFGDREITSIGPAESRGYVDARRTGVIGGGSRRKDGCGSDSTIRRELNCLVATFNHNVKFGRVEGACRVELPAETRHDSVEWLTVAQVGALIAAANSPLKEFIILAYYTAARRRAIENLTRFQVDLERGRISLMPPEGRVTRKRKPVVPIYPEMEAAVRRLMEGNGTRLFDSGISYYKRFVDLAAAVLDVDAHPHMLRHSRASHLLMAGEPLWKVAKLLGDTQATVERVYGHFDPEFLATKEKAG